MSKKCSIGKSCGGSCVAASYECQVDFDPSISAALYDTSTFIRSRNTQIDDLKEKYQEALQDENLLGKGSYGSVYSYGEYAIKVGEVDPNEIEIGALAGELEIGPKVKEFGTDEFSPLTISGNSSYSLVVMEKVKGQELGSLYGEENGKAIMRGSSKPHIVEDPEEAGRITDSLISLRAKMHRAGISHGDCHCENVIYDRKTGVMKIIDWGMSKKGANSEELLRDATRVIPSAIKNEVLRMRMGRSGEVDIGRIRKMSDEDILKDDSDFTIFTGLHSFRQLYDNSPNYRKLVDNYVRYMEDDSLLDEKVNEALYEGIE